MPVGSKRGGKLAVGLILRELLGANTVHLASKFFADQTATRGLAVQKATLALSMGSLIETQFTQVKVNLKALFEHGSFAEKYSSLQFNSKTSKPLMHKRISTLAKNMKPYQRTILAVRIELKGGVV